MKKIWKTPSFLSCTDLFAGAGGSSTGLADAGIEIVLAANHNKIALETHAANHPGTYHDLCDLRLRKPSHYPRTTMLWASPQCTHHSTAAGKKRKNLGQMDIFGEVEEWADPDEMRSRALMNDVLRFVDHHRYEIVIVENVTEVRYWTHYNAWLTSLHNMGYITREVFLNSMHVGVPQSRDRLYIVCWKAGNKAPNLDIRPRAHCSKCDCDVNAIWMKKNANKPLPGRVQHGKQYVYVCPKGHGEVKPYFNPASSIIDWSLPAPLIGERAKALSPNTMRRIQKGLEKYTERPFITTHYGSAVYRDVEDTMSTITTVNKQMLVMQQPFIVSQYGRDLAHRSVNDAMPTITTVNNQHSLCVPNAFLAPYYGTDESSHVREPMTAITTKTRHGLVRVDGAVDIGDCGYRMLTVHENMLGQSFPETYILCGTSGEVKQKQVGNAVSPKAARTLGALGFESLN